MKILVVAATENEIILLKDAGRINHEMDFLVAGVGMVATTYALTKRLSEKKYDLAINCGIAGSFDRSISIGEVVWVNEDIFSELGAEDGNEFLRLADLNLQGSDRFKGSFGFSKNLNYSFRKVTGITVNTVHGNEHSIEKISKRLNPQVESMEGAAFYFVCEKENVSSIQIRAISNYIEKRNREEWNIPLALQNLKTSFDNLIREL